MIEHDLIHTTVGRRLSVRVCVAKVIELLYFALLCVVFLFAYGVAAQSLLFPNTKDNWYETLYKIFYHPYLSVFQEFGTKHVSTRYALLTVSSASE